MAALNNDRPEKVKKSAASLHLSDLRGNRTLPRFGAGADAKRDWTGPDDAPELTEEGFDGEDLKMGGKVVRRGRPLGSNKRQIAIRLDADVIAHFKAQGAGWQTRINDTLRDWIASR